MIPRCERCNGNGFYTKYRNGRMNTNSCEYCLTTGYKGRWLIWLELRRLWWVEGYSPQFAYDQFSPMLYPPMPWTCRRCNGVGADFYGYDSCPACDGSGLRWRFMQPVILWYYKGYNPVKDWLRKRKDDGEINEDEIPF